MAIVSLRPLRDGCHPFSDHRLSGMGASDCDSEGGGLRQPHLSDLLCKQILLFGWPLNLDVSQFKYFIGRHVGELSGF